ncbi:MAG: OmpA family protein [Oligoflexus sp.]
MILNCQKKILKSCLALSLVYVATACSSDENSPEEIIQPSEEFSESALPESNSDDLLGDGLSDPTASESEVSSFDLSASTLYFDYDDDRVKDDQQFQLQQLADHLKNSGQSVMIEGHCDERGSVEYNLALGERRAYSVKNYLMTLGVGEEQLSTISYGEERSRSFGQDEAAYSQNRRVDFSTR